MLYLQAPAYGLGKAAAGGSVFVPMKPPATLEAPGFGLAQHQPLQLSGGRGEEPECHWIHKSKVHTYQYNIERVGGEREISSVCWLTPQVSTTVKAEPGKSQEPGIHSRSPTGRQRSNYWSTDYLPECEFLGSWNWERSQDLNPDFLI